MSRRRSSTTSAAHRSGSARSGIGPAAAATIWVALGVVTGVIESLLVALRHGYYFNTISSMLSFLFIPAVAYAVAGILIGAALTFALGVFVRPLRRAALLSASLCIPFFIFLFWGSALDGRFFGTVGNASGHIAMVAAAFVAFVLVRRLLSNERRASVRPVVIAATALLAAGVAAAIVALPHGSVGELSGADASDASDAQRPSILLVTLDTVRADRTGYSGYSSRFGPRADGLGITPRLDELAARGVVFSNAIVPEVVTDPSHASLLTAVPPWEHGVTRNAMPLRTDVPVLAEVLAGDGYNTAAFVSVEHLDGHISHMSRGFQFFVDRGWEDRYRHHVGGRILERHARTLFEHERSATETATAASRWLESQGPQSISESRVAAGVDRTEPFFLWVHIFDPHMPYLNHETGRVFGFDERELFVASAAEAIRDAGGDASAGMAAGIDGRAPAGEEMSTAGAAEEAYESEVRFADDGLGVLLDALERSGLSNSTVIVVTSDHGEHMEESHGPPENWFAHVDPYDEVCRVPLVMAGPGIVAGGQVERQVSSMDVAPTLLALAGIPVQLGGRAGIADLLAESTEEAPETAEPLVILSNPHRGIDHRAVRDGRWKVIERGGVPVEVYDLVSDPDELVNLVHSALDILTRFAPVFAETPIPQGFTTVEGSETELDPALREMLEALGYVQ